MKKQLIQKIYNLAAAPGTAGEGFAAMTKLAALLNKYNYNINDFGGPIPGFDPKTGPTTDDASDEKSEEIQYVTPKEIAAKMGISAKTLRARLRKHINDLPISEHEKRWVFKAEDIDFIINIVS